MNARDAHSLIEKVKTLARQLTVEEAERSRSQIATLNRGRGQNIKYRPYAFTEHGAIQVANVLDSPRAIAMGVLMS
jgi:ORF6N domain